MKKSQKPKKELTVNSKKDEFIQELWERPHWYDLSELIRFFPVGTIANWIEEKDNNLKELDRFGRYVPVKEQNCSKALDALANLKKASGEIEDFDLPDSGYGWFEDELPRDAESAQIEQVKKASDKRTDQNNLRIMAAMLEFMAGKISGQAHPHWETGPSKEECERIEELADDLQCDPDDHLYLRKWLEARYKNKIGVQGFDLDNLKQKFDQALELLNKEKTPK